LKFVLIVCVCKLTYAAVTEELLSHADHNALLSAEDLQSVQRFEVANFDLGFQLSLDYSDDFGNDRMVDNCINISDLSSDLFQ
jgi:hypothetical protein